MAAPVPTPLVIASGNAGKVREFAHLLADLPLEIRPQPEGLEVEETGTTFAENARLKATAVALATGCWALADDSGLAVDALGGAPGVHSARYAVSDPERIERLLRELAAATGAPATIATDTGATDTGATETVATETVATETGAAGTVTPDPAGGSRGAPASESPLPPAPVGDPAVPGPRRSARFTAALAVADPSGAIVLEVEGHCPGQILEAPRGSGGFGYDPVFLVPETGLTFAEMDKATKGRIGHRGRAFALLEPELRQLLG
ncbi:MAG: non-canonical purine NTP pyrophosphatase [Cyanobium sp.]